MNEQIFRSFSFYIPPEFEETWKRFIELCVPEEEKVYFEKIKELEKEKKNLKNVFNKNYTHSKKKFISTAIRKLIFARVKIMEVRLLQSNKIITAE